MHNNEIEMVITLPAALQHCTQFSIAYWAAITTITTTKKRLFAFRLFIYNFFFSSSSFIYCLSNGHLKSLAMAALHCKAGHYVGRLYMHFVPDLFIWLSVVFFFCIFKPLFFVVVLFYFICQVSFTALTKNQTSFTGLLTNLLYVITFVA